MTFFANMTFSIEEDITKKARKGFETKINSEPIVELQTKKWKERTIVGVGDLGFANWLRSA